MNLFNNRDLRKIKFRIKLTNANENSLKMTIKQYFISCNI